MSQGRTTGRRTRSPGASGGRNARPRKPVPPAAEAEADPAFERIAAAYARDSAVTAARMFGARALKANGKVFFMLVKGDAVFKLPAERVEALTVAGQGTRFDPGHGKLMREWVSIPPSQAEHWEALAGEARAHASR